MRYLFIDTNIYLSFFRLPSDDLDELKKLAALLRQNDLQLYMTQQVKDEFLRRRETVLAESFKMAREARLPERYPQILRNFDRFKKVSGAKREYSEQMSKLVDQATEAATKKNLHADISLDELFQQATDLEISAAVLGAAKERVDRGNPPGKGGSYGDAINWEAVLTHHPTGADLDLITGDGDYLSPLVEDRLHEFLAHEWETSKGSTVYVYPDMTAFFRAHYPDIQLSEEVELGLAIKRLIASENFLETHGAIAALSKMPEFTERQVSSLTEAALTNTQVRWILQDEDVNTFFRRIMKDYGTSLDQERREELQGLLDE